MECILDAPQLLPLQSYWRSGFMRLKTKIFPIVLVLSYVFGIAVATLITKEFPYYTAAALAFFTAAGIMTYYFLISKH